MSRFGAAMYDHLMSRADRSGLWKWRTRLLEGVAGDVVEIGCGPGLNLRYYTAEVKSLVLTEPDEHMRARARRRLEVPEGATAQLISGTAESIPLPDESVDFVVCTLVLCSVPDPAAAAAEARRVLRPGGGLVFLEHVASQKPSLLRWQQRLEPGWKRLTGGCHLTRRTEDTLREAGFDMDDVVRQDMRKAVGLARETIRGVAKKE